MWDFVELTCLLHSDGARHAICFSILPRLMSEQTAREGLVKVLDLQY